MRTLYSIFAPSVIVDLHVFGYNNGMTLQQIDDLCDQFEAALRNGETTSIESFLPNVEESARSTLLQELLQIEIQFAVETPLSEDSLRSMQGSLQKRFPEHLGLIQSLFRHTTQLRQIGEYEILGELGRGGMGTVYKAKHKLLQQTAAVKVLSQALLDDPQAVGRFRREMQLIGSLSHPNIVRALNAGESDGIHYLAMEFVDGITLQKLVEKIQAKANATPATLPIVPLGAACEMIRQAAIGLQNAHEFKLVHRDIKPANLMLDHRGTVKILDLGLGKFSEERRQDYHSSLAMAGMVIGTVDYISPEQCENSGEADVRSDLYSLGCTLHFLLTGKPVYSGSRYDTMRKKLMAHIVGDVPSLRQAIPGLPLAIEAILQKILSKDPADRFQTPIEFAEALEPFASFDDLWTLTCEVIPVDSTDTRSGVQHRSPYGYVQSSRQSIVTPAPVPYQKTTRFLWISALLASCLILGLLFGLPYAFHHAEVTRDAAKTQEAEQAIANAQQLRKEWKIAEAQAECQKAMRIWAAKYLDTKDMPNQMNVLVNQMFAAELRWCNGDVQGASRELQSVQEAIDRAMTDFASKEDSEDSRILLDSYKMFVLKRWADLTLFGGATSGLNPNRFANAIFRYDKAASLAEAEETRVLESGSGNWMPKHSVVIRWKQAILLALNGDVEQAATLLEKNPMPSIMGDTATYAALLRQLAEAVLHYYQSEGGTDRNRKLQTFRQLFSSQDSPIRGAAVEPEIVALLMFCSEFLISDALKNEDWETLSSDILLNRHATAGFVRQYPGAIPFVRRFYDLLVQSAALVYERSERQRDKQAQIENIAQILDRMRPLDGATETVGMERPTLVLFFLPGTATEPGIAVFYPRDGRQGTLYRLPLTRQMVKQPVSGKPFPPLDEQLLQQVAEEKSAQRKVRISWTDKAAWARAEEALTESDYPYKEELPLQ
jgi:serine/threonine protein kinase